VIENQITSEWKGNCKDQIQQPYREEVAHMLRIRPGCQLLDGRSSLESGEG
jgi:hypothetical protein